ncbi:hypothetical protein J4E93_006448 [Alternaria ventricosa]|uniref:uncharacterized protein n=1 Tax=Alternaria ventricosa TaxID=1187951 RepID=UPI0020C1DC4D|nr:uncharacterized protein J4E93_006448 [Alternaria ventricosa]KAI4644543.1 hypothetical protein J4E93_006448 [Alternaria ventricosa]
MRAHYLVVGLLGLAGLAFAAPTPEATAVSLIATSQPSSIATPDFLPRCNMAEPANQWLMTICGSHGSASTIPNTWPGVCGVLTGGVAYEVTSTAQVPELMCKFYDDSDLCNSDFLVATFQHHEQIPEHLGKRIKYVQCGALPTLSGSGGLEVRANDASPVLEAEDIKHAEADDALPLHDLNPTQPEDTSSWSPSPCMNPGSDYYFLIVCGGGNANWIPNNWMNACVRLSDTVGQHVGTVIQNAHIMCKYYDDSNECDGNFEAYSDNTSKDIEIFSYPPQVGNKLKYVKCQKGEWRRGVASSSACMNPDASHYFLSICGGGNANNIPNGWMNQCVSLTDNVGYHVETMTQNARIQCKYYDDSNACNGNIEGTSITYEKEESFTIDPEVGKRIKYVMCTIGQWRRDVGEIEAREADAPSESPEKIIDAKFAKKAWACQEPLPGIAYQVLLVCSQAYAQQIPEIHKTDCMRLADPVALHVDSFLQDANMTCDFYDSSNGCSGKQIFHSTTREEQYRFDIDSKWGTWIKHVRCRWDDTWYQTGGIEAREVDASSSLEVLVALEIVVAPDTDASPDADVSPDWACVNPGPDNQYLVVCGHGAGQLMTNKLLGACLELNAGVTHNVDSFLQDSGLMCRFYNDPHLDCKGEPIYIAQTLNKQHIFNIDAKYGTRFKYVQCYKGDHRRSDVPGIEAREADTSLEAPSIAAEEPSGPIARLISDTGHTFEYQENFAGLCIKLRDGVSRHLTYIALVDHTLCRFYESGCGIKPLFIAKSETPYTRIAVPLDVSKKLTHAVCGPSNAPHNEIDARADAISLEATSIAIESATETTTNANLRTVATVFAENGGPLLVRENYINYCIKLNSTTAYHVTRAAVIGNIACRFSEYGCLNDPLLVVGADHYVDEPVPSDLGKRITHVICEHQAPRTEIEARADATSLEASPAAASATIIARIYSSTSNMAVLSDNDKACVRFKDDMSHDVTKVEMGAHTFCVFYNNACSRAKDPVFTASTTEGYFSRNVPADASKEITHVICGFKHHDAMETRADATTASSGTLAQIFSSTSYTSVHDSRACVTLGDYVSRDVTKVTVGAHTLCVFYDNDCTLAKYPVFSVSTDKEQFTTRDVPADVGKKITHVLCGKKDGWANVEARADDTSLETTAQKTKMARVFGDTADLYIYDDNDADCVALSKHVANDVVGVQLEAGILCVFYTNACNIAKFPIFRASNSGPGTLHVDIPGYTGRDISHVACGKKHTLDAEIDAWAATTLVIDARAETSPTINAQAVTTPIVDATALTTLHLDGPEIARVFSKTAMFGIKDEDANTCIPLGDSIANDLFAVAVHENVLCRFWKDSCNVAKGPLYQLHSNKGDVASKVPSDVGKQLTHFMCMRTEPQAAIFTPEALETMADIGYMAFFFSSTSQLGINDWDAKKCIPLGDSVAHDLFAVAVPQNVSCSFYKDGCDVSKSPIFLVASGQGGGGVHDVPSEIGKRLTHVICMRVYTQPHAEIIAREEVSPSNVALITSAASTGNTPDPATDMTITQTEYPRDGYSPVDLAVGSLFTCSYEQTDSCWIMDALNDCLEFPSNTAHNVMILEQAKGSYCWYYNKPGCKDSDEVFHHTSAPDNPSAFIGTYFKDLASVVCGGPGVTSEMEVIPHDHRIEKITNIDSRIYANHISKRDSLPTDSPPAWTLPRAIRVGEVFACSEDHASGCWYINAQNKCTNFPAQVAHKSQFIMQAKGTWCKYYLEAGCSHEAWQYVSTPTDHTTFGVKTNLVASVECQASKVTANEVTKRDWPPGSTTVCHQAHYQFCTDNAINAIQQCANFAPADQGPVSIIQYGGAYCKWYRDFGCGGGEDKSPMSIDSRGGEQWVDDLGVEDRFKSVKCETYQW